MRNFFTAISYIFHPLFVPIGGTVAYFLVTPKYVPLELQSGNILPIFILTVIIPIIFFLILRNMGLVSSVFIPSLKERIYPLVISIVLYTMVLYKVIAQNYISELYYFFAGLLVAVSATLLILFFKIKTSMHLLGMGSILIYVVGLSIHFETNITLALGLLTLLTGLVTTSRLYLKAHSVAELLIGFFLGVFSQLFTFKYWL
ncbi:hypothetical protein [Allomuricauda sp. d1]|uniref:hypothetical protein n=1 Tax=Allomuricauda sp. d1 TaxID=3136725 RepID=UPI0031D87F7D